jgi:hypothetical protein
MGPIENSICEEPQSLNPHRIIESGPSNDRDLVKTLLSKTTPLDYISPQGMELNYTPLPDNSWFRLLVLQSGIEQDDIVCHLASIRREEATQKYEALSYTWSDCKVPPEWRNSKVLCNGNWIKVGDNLGFALRRLRSISQPRVIWVDGLNINQADKREQSEQVQAMSSIYSQARQTVIWLGHTDDNEAKEAFENVCKLVNGWNPSEHASYWSMNDDTKDYDYHEPIGSFCDSDQAAWRSVVSLFQTQWFERRWVIQESALSSSATVYWGRCKISWRHIGLAAAILRMQHDSRVRASRASGVYHAYLIFRLSNQKTIAPVKLSFLQLLRLTQDFQVSVSHDIVYALLGIATTDNDPNGERFIDVDYTVSEDDLKLTLAGKLLQSQSLSFLCNAGLERQASKNRTWVPTWRCNSLGMMAPWSISSTFHPSKGLPFKRWPTDNPSHLAVDGIQASTVLWTSQPFHHGWRYNQQALFGLVQLPAFSPISEETLQRFARALSAGRDAYGAPDPNPSSLTRDFAALWAKAKYWGTQEGDRALQIVQEFGQGGDAQNFLNVADVLCAGRRLFVTTNGHLGFGPNDAQPGDAVVVLGGANMPFLLRKTDSLFQLLGECYIDEIMSGEAVEAMQKGQPLRGYFDVGTLATNLFSFNALGKKDKEMMESELTKLLEFSKKEYELLKVHRFDIC